MSSKREDRRSGSEWEHAATRKVDTLSEAFAEDLLGRGVPDEAEAEAGAHERITAPELPDDPEATGAHADRAALDAARLIVVGSDPAIPVAREARAPALPSATPLARRAPAAGSSTTLRAGLALLVVIVLAAAGLALLAGR